MNNEYANILIINGSPRKQKNCTNIIDDIILKFETNNISYKVYNIYDMDINYCTACGFCDYKGYCKFKDDMTPMYREFDESKGCIVVSPVHFDCVSAKVKTVVDRTQAIYASKYILNKPSIDRNKPRRGMYIAVGGSTPYETQFMGGQIVMDFFFKSINSKLKYNYHIKGSDKLSYKQNEKDRENLNNMIDDYIKEIKELD